MTLYIYNRLPNGLQNKIQIDIVYIFNLYICVKPWKKNCLHVLYITRYSVSYIYIRVPLSISQFLVQLTFLYLYLVLYKLWMTKQSDNMVDIDIIFIYQSLSSYVCAFGKCIYSIQMYIYIYVQCIHNGFDIYNKYVIMV